MKEYIDLVDKEISNGKVDKKFIDNHLVKIGFFQHERFIHLCVTLFYSAILILFIFLTSISYIFISIVIILVVFEILYIIHYFYLENGVQYMYKQYDKLKELSSR